MYKRLASFSKLSWIINWKFHIKVNSAICTPEIRRPPSAHLNFGPFAPFLRRLGRRSRLVLWDWMLKAQWRTCQEEGWIGASPPYGMELFAMQKNWWSWYFANSSCNHTQVCFANLVLMKVDIPADLLVKNQFFGKGRPASNTSASSSSQAYTAMPTVSMVRLNWRPKNEKSFIYSYWGCFPLPNIQLGNPGGTFSSVLLHNSNDAWANVISVIIDVLQWDENLRIDVECIWCERVIRNGYRIHIVFETFNVASFVSTTFFLTRLKLYCLNVNVTWEISASACRNIFLPTAIKLKRAPAFSVVAIVSHALRSQVANLRVEDSNGFSILICIHAVFKSGTTFKICQLSVSHGLKITFAYPSVGTFVPVIGVAELLSASWWKRDTRIISYYVNWWGL